MRVNVGGFVAHKDIEKGSFGIQEIRLTKEYINQQTVYTIEMYDNLNQLVMSFRGTPRKFSRFVKLLNNIPINTKEIIDRIR